ncbi:hypothetical protein KP509_13G013000 [Ceratopteris richardii]|nr:hypothetical protein KP509_13G013000 [Ceratopteris richardii]
MFTNFQRLKIGMQLKRDEALARALQDSDDQEQLMIMLSLQESQQEAHQQAQQVEGNPRQAAQQQAQHIERNPRQDDIDPDAMSYEELMGLSEAVGTQNIGLTSREIRKLSAKKYRKCCLGSNKEEQCVICQEYYRGGDSVITLPCKHMYHKGCIRTWLEMKKVCPVCNAEVSVR